MLLKKQGILACLALTISLSASADTVYTTIVNVIDSAKSNKLLVLSGADGRVYKAKGSEKNEKFLRSFIGKAVAIDFTLNGKEAIINNVSSVDPEKAPTPASELNYFAPHARRPDFEATQFKSEDEVKTVFNSILNEGDKTVSQCFKRAHIWSYEMWSKLGIYSEKVFIFYTQRYIQLEEFEWWFHVAPSVRVGSETFVLDRTFFDKPIKMNEWKSAFIHSDKITCPVVDNYDEFDKNQWKKLCYLMKVPMFYFSPLNIENRDHKGEIRNHWVLEELQDARRAFGGYASTYEFLDTGSRTVTH